MRNCTLACFAVAFCTQLASAQNEFEIFPGDDGVGARFASRGDARDDQGALFQGYPTSHFRGIGGNASTCELTELEFIVQDQNGVTQEAFDVVLRRGDANGPTLGDAALIVDIPVTTPIGPDVAYAVQLTIALTTPATIPCDEVFFAGHQFAADPDWPRRDGVAASIFRYRQDPLLVETPNHAWQFVGDPTSGTVSQPSGRLLNMGLRGDAPTMNIGASSLFRPTLPDFGVAGMYPDVTPRPGAEDGLLFRVRDGTNRNGTALVLLGNAFDPPFPLQFLGLDANLWLNASLSGIVARGSINPGGEAIVLPAWLDFGNIRRFAGLGFVYFQAITFTTGSPPMNVRLSNAVATKL